jgi:hypothetical protein
MFNLLVVLALIPLALLGAVIVLGVGWMLLPYAFIISGGGAAWLMDQDPASRPYVHWAVMVALVGAGWAVLRWKK